MKLHFMLRHISQRILLTLLLQALLVVPLLGHWHALAHGVPGSAQHPQLNQESDSDATPLFALNHNCADYDAQTTASPLHFAVPTLHTQVQSVRNRVVPVQAGWQALFSRPYSARAPPLIS